MKKLIPILLSILISPVYAQIYNSLIIQDVLKIGSLTISSPGNFNFLNVIGNANIGGSLNVQGSLTVNGVPISSNGGGGSGCTGTVVGPSSPTTAGAVVLFTDTTGNAIEQSAAPVTINPSTNDMANVNNLTITANINLPATASDYSQGVITLNGTPFIHAVVGNTSIGQLALSQVTTGNHNVAAGSGALQSLSTGTENVAVGTNALHNNSSANNNVAVGVGALAGLSVSPSNDNIGIGSGALASTQGSQNVGIGSNAFSNLGNNTSISNNIALGYNAGTNLNNTGTNVNNIYIGSVGPASLGAENNTIRIGSAQTACFIAGINGATSSGGTAVFVNSSGQLGITTSSIRYKKDITSMEHAIAQLIQLRPVRFRYKIDHETSPREYGLIAEEVEDVMPDLVIYKDGKPETVKYHLFSAILIKAIQELAIQNNELRQSIEQLIQQHSGAIL